MAPPPDLHVSLGAAPLQRDVVVVEGPEAIDYLQGQLSQDVAALGPGESAPAFVLQPTGKVDALVRVTRLEEDAALLDVDRGWGDALLARLRRFLLRTKAELVPATWSGLAVRGPGSLDVLVPAGARGLTVTWPGVAGLDVLSDGEVALAGVPLVEREALEVLRIECGVPAMGAELTDASIPAEAGQWWIDAAVSFTKGCYTGQELTARIDSRGGNVPHPVRGVLVEGDPVPVGTELERDGAVVGRVTSTARSAVLGSIALAVTRRSVEPSTSVELVGPLGRGRGMIRELPLR